MGKINILVIPSDNVGGVGFYRSIQPHIQLEKQFPEKFSVTIEMNPNFNNLESFDKYNIIHIHKGLFKDAGAFDSAMSYFKNHGIYTVMDIDDSWNLGHHHPMSAMNRIYKIDELIKNNLRRFDAVTTTTEIFAEEIRKFNKNVFVLPNSIDPTDERFITHRKPSDKLRVGMIMGSTHEYDMQLLNNITNGLSDEALNKIQFVLCGYDLRGTIKEIDKSTGEAVERNITPKESVWYRYEKMLTNDYSTVSPEYRKFLELFIPNAQYPNVENEPYKRCWTKDINHYYEHYNECDVLLAPLEPVEFNRVKSQLKVIECAFSHTAIIASDFGPYTIDLKNAIQKGGLIDSEGNAILIDENRNHKDWKKALEKLVKNPELVKQLQDNLYNDIHEKYDLKNVTAYRAELYESFAKSVEN